METTVQNKYNLHLVGPRRARVVCDINEIYLDDPGRGTPIMVYWEDYSGTFCCCRNEGEIDGVQLPRSIRDWLRSIEDTVSDWHADALEIKRKG